MCSGCCTFHHRLRGREEGKGKNTPQTLPIQKVKGAIYKKKPNQTPLTFCKGDEQLGDEEP